MSETTTLGAQLLPTAINMPDHAIRQSRWYQIYVRLARPTLDWCTIGWFIWCTMAEPITSWMLTGKPDFNAVATPMCLLWCAAVYGIKTYEKKAGVA